APPSRTTVSPLSAPPPGPGKQHPPGAFSSMIPVPSGLIVKMSLVPYPRALDSNENAIRESSGDHAGWLPQVRMEKPLPSLFITAIDASGLLNGVVSSAMRAPSADQEGLRFVLVPPVSRLSPLPSRETTQMSAPQLKARR